MTITDDHSRFNLCLSACECETSETVKSRLIQAFECYGLPNQILSDNGPAWSCMKRRYALNRLEAWLIKQGVDPIHGRPYHPQTQGKEERFHRTLNDELLRTRVAWESLEQCDEAFQDWRVIYNELRPHHSLDDEVPLNRYEPSARKFEACLADRDIREDYPPDAILRKVDHSGEISYLGRKYYVGMGIWKEHVVIQHCHEQEALVSYGWKLLGRIDLSVPKKSRNHLKRPNTQ